LDTLIVARYLNRLPYQRFECREVVFGRVMEDNMIVANALRRVKMPVLFENSEKQATIVF
jgi:hypothetical protein